MSHLNNNDLCRIFEKLDKNGDGLVSLEELNWLLERIGVQFTLEELESLVGKTTLHLNEFLFFYESISSKSNEGDRVDGEGGEDDTNNNDEENDLVKAFEVYDLNGDGYITSEELQSVLSRLGLWDEQCGKDCRTMICAYDENFDGMLDFQEFKNMMLLTTS